MEVGSNSKINLETLIDLSKVNRRRFLKVLIGIGALVGSAASIGYYFMGTVGKKVVGEMAQMLPPGQYAIDRLRVLHVGPIPEFDEKTWTLEVYGLVKNSFALNYEELKNLPEVTSISAFHCVTGWSKLENKWKGIQFRTIMEMANVSENAQFATIESEYDYTTSLTLKDLSRDDVLLAYGLDDEELPPQHGGPLRLVVPQKYGYKSAKWVRKIKFTEKQELGYWESRGYSNTASALLDDRYAK